MDLDLAGRVAVVTGGSKGVGLAVTRTLLEEGARIVAASRSRTPGLDALEGSLLHVPVDLMDPGAPAEVIACAVEEFGGVDILVNNAGGPQEVADAVVLLVSPRSASTTGAEIAVDGGFVKAI
jgi:NAD(P)-dependent dehydrogenase (short-subunit alcohol dehydrogenase family)